ncbi:hypothetical protein [uncultured Campylobacter sp.]|uniref:hypothetical protein n=1 Tax=uncultured Campylobacter sp. TaxID=218934 RepID=UPI0026029A4A|nr:hypothetical protein [uncultured Campylobacter sp.]
MKFKTLTLAIVFFFATGINAELATEANSINFRKTSGAEQNLADAKDAKFQGAHFKSAEPQRAVQTQTHRKKRPSSTKRKIFTAWTSGCFAAHSLMEATPRSCTS